MKMPRKAMTMIATAAIVLALAGCKPPQAPATGSTVKPPATATHAQGIKDATIYVQWSFGSTYCTYSLTITDPANRVVFTSAGQPATGSTFVVPLVSGRFAGWIQATSSNGKPCTSSLSMIDSL